MKKQNRLIYLYLAIAIIMLACLATPAPTSQQVPSATSPSSNSTEIPPTPSGPVMKPGDYRQTITSGGTKRTYILHVPQGYDGSTPLPLVFVLHGFGGNAAGMVKLTGFNEKADQENFFVAYLNGTEVTSTEKGVSGQAWNNGITPDLDFKVDDVAFVRDLLKHLQGQLYVDGKRVYAAGFSNGAMMSHRLGADLSDLLAGIAVVEGTIGVAQSDGSYVTIPKPVGPIPVLIVHGKADPNLPYEGGQATEGAGKLITKSAADAVRFWTEADGCTGAPQKETSADGNVIKEDYTVCAAGNEVLFYTVVNGQHEWPTAGGHTRFSATDAIWEFFSKYP